MRKGAGWGIVRKVVGGYEHQNRATKPTASACEPVGHVLAPRGSSRGALVKSVGAVAKCTWDMFPYVLLSAAVYQQKRVLYSPLQRENSKPSWSCISQKEAR
jgi:hypothetical protein